MNCCLSFCCDDTWCFTYYFHFNMFSKFNSTSTCFKGVQTYMLTNKEHLLFYGCEDICVDKPQYVTVGIIIMLWSWNITGMTKSNSSLYLIAKMYNFKIYTIIFRSHDSIFLHFLFKTINFNWLNWWVWMDCTCNVLYNLLSLFIRRPEDYKTQLVNFDI